MADKADSIGDAVRRELKKLTGNNVAFSPVEAAADLIAGRRSLADISGLKDRVAVEKFTEFCKANPGDKRAAAALAALLEKGKDKDHKPALSGKVAMAAAGAASKHMAAAAGAKSPAGLAVNGAKALAATMVAGKASAAAAGRVVMPIAEQIVRTMKPPKTYRSKGDYVIEHQEYVTDVAIGADSSTGLPRTGGAFGVDVFTSINPGNADLFPWLSIEARGYQEYKFEKLDFQLATTSPTTTQGMVCAAVNPDASDPPPTTKLEMLNMKAATRGPIYKAVLDQHLPIGDVNADMKWRFVRGDLVPAETDVKMYDCGTFVAASADLADGELGEQELWVRYRIRLRIPVLDANLGQRTGGIAAQVSTGASSDTVGASVNGRTFFGFPSAAVGDLIPTLQLALNRSGARFALGDLLTPWCASAPTPYNCVEFTSVGLYLAEVQCGFEAAYPAELSAQRMFTITDSPSAISVGEGVNPCPALLASLGIPVIPPDGDSSLIDTAMRYGVKSDSNLSWNSDLGSPLKAAEAPATTNRYAWNARFLVDVKNVVGAVSRHPRLYFASDTTEANSATLRFLNCTVIPFPRNLMSLNADPMAGSQIIDVWPAPRRAILARVKALNDARADEHSEALKAKDLEIERLRKKLAVL